MPEWIQRIDNQVVQWVRENQDKWWEYNLTNITALGSTTLLALVSLLALGILLLTKQYKKALLFVLLVVGAYFATQGIKTAVARQRPASPQKQAVARKGPAAVKKHSASFPSSHASLSMAVFGMLAFCVRQRGEGRASSSFFTRFFGRCSWQ